MKNLVSFILLLFFVFLAGCSEQTANQKGNDERIVVTTTIGQIADAVKNIGGDKVVVQSLMGTGTDPHLYKATQGDIKKLQEADVIFYSGLHLEGKMLDIFEKMNETIPTYAISEMIPKEMIIKNNSAIDPHVWFDIDLWQIALKTVVETLQKMDPDNSEYYQNNAEEYFTKLEEIKRYAREEIKKIPDQQRVLVTAHDAFGYFGDAYDIKVMGLQGLSTDAEYGLADVQKLVNTLVTRNIKAVFIESSISDRSINAVIEGAKKKNHEVRIGGELYSDAMGKEGTPEGTYIGMYKHNVKIIVESLK